MSAKVLIYVTFAAFALSASAVAQGFANLGRVTEGFTMPEPGYSFEFPKDHGAHPDFQIEWWYLTANLRDDQGRELGLQWTLFRSAMAPREAEGWSSPQFWMGHAAVTTAASHYVAERLSRGGIGQAGVTAAPFEAWIDDWYMGGDTMDALTLRASGADFAYDMTLTAEGPIIFHGQEGYSQKSDSGRASYYYSQPFYRVSGMLNLPEGDVRVTGNAWLDREWASQPLAATQVSWDWFSMVFDDGVRMMGFTLHDSDGSDYTQATWIMPDGQTIDYPDGAFEAEVLDRTEVAGRLVPTRWQVRLEEQGVDVTVTALNPGAWMTTSVPYWEGPVRINGTHSGRGYLEMTGY